jgi:hypothetical protein
MKHNYAFNKQNLVVIILVAASGFLVQHLSLIAYADNLNPSVYSPDSKPYGMTYPEWTSKWWQWLVSIPEHNSPAADDTGKNCDQKQNGPVWFLAGTTGGAAERTCSIPAGKAILFPIVNSECSYLEFPAIKSLPELIKCARADNDRTTNLRATVDGVSLQQLAEKYRILSPFFGITFPQNNLLGAPPGNTQMISDGFWVFLQPLAIGKHEIHFSGLTVGNPTTGTSNFAIDTTYHITVR